MRIGGNGAKNDMTQSESAPLGLRVYLYLIALGFSKIRRTERKQRGYKICFALVLGGLGVFGAGLKSEIRMGFLGKKEH